MAICSSCFWAGVAGGEESGGPPNLDLMGPPNNFLDLVGPPSNFLDLVGPLSKFLDMASPPSEFLAGHSSD